MAGDDRIGLRAAAGLGGLVIAVFLAITTEVVPVGLLPQISRDYEVAPSVAGLLLTVYAALVAVLSVPLTLATVRLPRKPLLLVTIALYTLGNLVIALAPSFAVVCAGRAIGGVGHALFFSISTAYAAGLVPARLQGRAITIALSGASLGYVLGVPLATAVGATVGQRAAFGALTVGGLVVGLVVAGLLPPIATPPVRVAREAAGPTAGLVLVAVVNAVAFLAHYALYTYVSQVLAAGGVPERVLGALLFLLGAAGVVGLSAASAVIDRRPRIGLITALVVAAVFAGALLIVHGVAGTIVAAVAWNIAWGAIPSLFAAACLRTRVLSADLSAAVNNAAANVGIGGGAAVGGGALALGGLPAATAFCAGGFAVSAALVGLLPRAFPARPPAA